MKSKAFKQLLLLNLLAAGLVFSPLQAAEYPPALNYDDFLSAANLDTADANLYFGRQLLNVRMCPPDRDIIVSETAAWLWNNLAPEPAHRLPPIDFSQTPGTS